MKLLKTYCLVILFYFIGPTLSIAQVDCRPILQKAIWAFNNGEGNLDKALEYLQDTEICDYQNQLEEERQMLQKRIFEAIKNQKERAENTEKQALISRDSTRKSYEKVDSLRREELAAKERAQKNEAIANESQNRELARSLALQSLQLNPEKATEKATLSLRAFRLFDSLKIKDTAIFSAVYNALYSSYVNNAAPPGTGINIIENDAASVGSIDFLPDEKTFFTSGRNGGVKKWTVDQWRAPQKPKLIQNNLPEFGINRYIYTSMALSADGKLLALGGWNEFIQLFDIPQETLRTIRLPVAGIITNLVFTSKGNLFFSTSDQSIYYLDNSGGPPRIWYNSTNFPLGVLTTAGRYLIAGDLFGGIMIWDLEKEEPSNAPVFRDTTPSGPISALSADVLSEGKALQIAVGYENGSLAVIHFQTDQTEVIKNSIDEYFHHISRISDLAFSKNGELLAVASYDKKVSIIFLHSIYKASPLILDHFNDWTTAVAFADSDRQIVVGTRSGRLQFFCLDPNFYAQEIERYKQGSQLNLLYEQSISVDPCQDQYDVVLRLFRQGDFREVAGFFQKNQDCLKTNFKLIGINTSRVDIAALMTETYLFLADQASAKDQFENLLKIDPFYPITENLRHPELGLLGKKFRVGVFTFGVNAGFNWSLVSNLRHFFREDVRVSKERFSPRRWNMHGSGFIGYRPALDKPWEFFFEYHYAPRTYKYQGNYALVAGNMILDQVSLSFEEKMLWNNYLLYARYNFNYKLLNFGNRATYYILFGGGLGQLQVSDLEVLNVKFSIDSDKNKNLAAFEATNCPDGKSLRKSVNLLALTGIGIKYKVSPSIFFFTEARYDLTLQNIVKEENRYSCQQLIDNFFYVDNDMMVHTFYLLGGVSYQFYTPKVRRK